VKTLKNLCEDIDPQIHVSGYGTVSMSRAKKEIVETLRELEKLASKDEFKDIETVLKKGVLATLLSSIIKAQQEIN
jgi:hypothetical protein